MRNGLKYLAGLVLAGGIGYGGYSAFFNNNVIKVGLYPWVPYPAQIQTAVQNAWDKLNTGYTLQFADPDEWDGGYKNNPDNLDVFVFDAINLKYFKKNGYLTALDPSEVDNLDDIVNFAKNGVTIENKMYGIPLLGCGNFLFYYKGDELANASKFSTIAQELGNCTYTSEVPPDKRGIMLDMAGGTTNACLYVEVLSDNTGSIPNVLPDNIDPNYIAIMRQLMTSASYYNVNDCDLDGNCGNDGSYIRAEWFDRGYGRSYIGFTESMSKISPDKLDQIAFKPMPFSETNSTHLFYSDVIAINAKRVSDPESRKIALQLANLIGSAEVVIQGIGPDGNRGPQYLMPVRASVFDALSGSYPKYSQMKQIVFSVNPTLFVLPDNSKEWINTMKDTIKSNYTSNYTCGCDFKSDPIYSQSDADAKCPGVCSNHGGWNGQWISNACGCNTCSIQ